MGSFWKQNTVIRLSGASKVLFVDCENHFYSFTCAFVLLISVSQIVAHFGGAFMNPDTHESDLQQQQIQEEEEKNLKNPMLLVLSPSNIHAHIIC